MRFLFEEKCFFYFVCFFNNIMTRVPFTLSKTYKSRAKSPVTAGKEYCFKTPCMGIVLIMLFAPPLTKVLF